MKRIIAIVLMAGLCPAYAAPDPASAATVAQRLAEAKAACPDCYRVINTNGVFVGVTKAQYDAIEAAKQSQRDRIKASMERRRKHTPRKHPLSGRGPMQLRRGFQKPIKGVNEQ